MISRSPFTGSTNKASLIVADISDIEIVAGGAVGPGADGEVFRIDKLGVGEGHRSAGTIVGMVGNWRGLGAEIDPLAGELTVDSGVFGVDSRAGWVVDGRASSSGGSPAQPMINPAPTRKPRGWNRR